MARAKGFSLVELLIVVAIILIIAAIAIPSLLRSRIAANEASAVGSLRIINTAEITYNTTYGATVGFANLSALGPYASGGSPSSAAAGLLDANLAAGAKSGYTFTVVALGTNNSTYESTAAPQSPGTSGRRYFCSDPSLVIQFNTTATGGACASGANTPI
ncbi:MAG TPA: prepilin-type N-terminal cleavage/methylation domain-containing protein [Terriglobales bacterium]|nr:prepilin-type N-terminal cleavage/methylation domain-containing protein [Terriglobales bacterium]